MQSKSKGARLLSLEMDKRFECLHRINVQKLVFGEVVLDMPYQRGDKAFHEATKQKQPCCGMTAMESRENRPHSRT